jgi:hypothetical protein
MHSREPLKTSEKTGTYSKQMKIRVLKIYNLRRSNFD